MKVIEIVVHGFYRKNPVEQRTSFSIYIYPALKAKILSYSERCL